MTTPIHRHTVDKDIKYCDERTGFGQLYETVFDGHGENHHILMFMAIKRKRGAPESHKGWMEKREREITESLHDWTKWGKEAA